MRLLTLGRLSKVWADIAAELTQGESVLDIGCGTGTLAIMLADGGCQVMGIDSSPAMLAVAAAKLGRRQGELDLTWRQMSAVDLDTAFPDESFDAVVSTLVFSELSGDEIEYTLRECWRVLAGGGRLFIADEVLPESSIGNVASWCLRLPLTALTFCLTQATTRRVARLAERIEGAGFGLKRDRRYLCGTLRLYEARKGQVECSTG
jgi:ubiquinone/menaquinone biosynthesis C-methylase UbiE